MTRERPPVLTYSDPANPDITEHWSHEQMLYALLRSEDAIAANLRTILRLAEDLERASDKLPTQQALLARRLRRDALTARASVMAAQGFSPSYIGTHLEPQRSAKQVRRYLSEP
jgi:siderophore synthetase component